MWLRFYEAFPKSHSSLRCIRLHTNVSVPGKANLSDLNSALVSILLFLEPELPEIGILHMTWSKVTILAPCVYLILVKATWYVFVSKSRNIDSEQDSAILWKTGKMTYNISTFPIFEFRDQITIEVLFIWYIFFFPLWWTCAIARLDSQSLCQHTV